MAPSSGSGKPAAPGAGGGGGAAMRSPASAADAVGALLGTVAGKLIAATILVSMFSAANELMLTSPRAFYALGAMSIFVYRRRARGAALPFRVPGYPATPILFVVSASAIVLNTLVTQPRNVAAGLAIVLLGTPAYFAWKGRRRAAADATGPLPAGEAAAAEPGAASGPPAAPRS